VKKEARKLKKKKLKENEYIEKPKLKEKLCKS
jgi:hypothetical protein